MDVQFSAIWAQDPAGGVGLDYALPWPKHAIDMAWFKRHTLSKTVVMGYNTWVSLGHKPLPDRQNVVLSNVPLNDVPHLSTCNQTFAGTYWVKPEEFLDYIPKVWSGIEVMIIGGPATYARFGHLVSRVYLTIFQNEYISKIPNYRTNIGMVVEELDEWDLVFFDEFTSPDASFQILQGDGPIIFTQHFDATYKV